MPRPVSFQFVSILAATVLLIDLSIGASTRFASGGNWPQGAVAPSPDEPCRGTKFRGLVRRGEAFRRNFGKGLVFLLEPIGLDRSNGWAIEVVPEKNPEIDFVSVVTSPYQVGPERPDGAPYVVSRSSMLMRSPRRFYFVENEDDHRKAAAAVSRLLVPGNLNERGLAEARKKLEKIKTGRGEFFVLDERVSVGTYPFGRQAQIEELRFEVRLCPSQWRRTSIPNANSETAH